MAGEIQVPQFRPYQATPWQSDAASMFYQKMQDGIKLAQNIREADQHQQQLDEARQAQVENNAQSKANLAEQKRQFDKQEEARQAALEAARAKERFAAIGDIEKFSDPGSLEHNDAAAQRLAQQHGLVIGQPTPNIPRPDILSEKRPESADYTPAPEIQGPPAPLQGTSDTSGKPLPGFEGDQATADQAWMGQNASRETQNQMQRDAVDAQNQEVVRFSKERDKAQTNYNNAPRTQSVTDAKGHSYQINTKLTEQGNAYFTNKADAIEAQAKMRAAGGEGMSPGVMTALEFAHRLRDPMLTVEQKKLDLESYDKIYHEQNQNVRAKDAAAAQTVRARATSGRGEEGLKLRKDEIVANQTEKAVKALPIRTDVGKFYEYKNKFDNMGKTGFNDAGALYSMARELTQEKGPLSGDDVRRTLVGKAGALAQFESWVSGKFDGTIGSIEREQIRTAISLAFKQKAQAVEREAKAISTRLDAYAKDPDYATAIGQGESIYNAAFQGMPGFKPRGAAAQAAHKTRAAAGIEAQLAGE